MNFINKKLNVCELSSFHMYKNYYCEILGPELRGHAMVNPALLILFTKVMLTCSTFERWATRLGGTIREHQIA